MAAGTGILCIVKYAVVILGGAGGEALEDLDGLTALEAALAPNLAALALRGRVGGVATSPPGWSPGADTALLTLLGCDPVEAGARQGPLEASGLGLEVAPDASAVCAALVCVGSERHADEAGVVLDEGHDALTTAEARELLEAVGRAWEEHEPALARRLELTPIEGRRALLVDSSGRSYANAQTHPAHECVRQHWRRGAPSGEQADTLVRLMELSHEALLDHEVNRAREENGLRAANMLWLWGAGRPIACKGFLERYGLRAAMLTGRAVAAGAAWAVGIDRLPVPGLGASLDVDYESLREHAVGALDRYDVVIVDVSTPGEAARLGDVQEKIRAIEAADGYVVGPLLEKLEGFGDAEADPSGETAGWRMLVVVDRGVSVKTRAPVGRLSPFALAGGWVRSVVQHPFSEKGAAGSDLIVDPGEVLMEYALFGGRKRTRRVRRAQSGSERS